MIFDLLDVPTKKDPFLVDVPTKKESFFGIHPYKKSFFVNGNMGPPE